MHKAWYVILAICFILISALLYNVLFMNQVDSTRLANKGVVDLEEVSLKDNNVISLNGEWLLYEAAFTLKQSNIETGRYIKVPGSWGKQDYFRLNTGYGTYQLTIELQEKYVGEMLGLYIPNVATAYEVWIDGEKKISNGIIGVNEKEVVPVNYARTIYFVPKSSKVELTIPVSNFSQRKGGLWDTIYFGKADAISLVSEKKIALQLLVAGALIMMGIYLLIIYFLRKSQRSAFYLGLFTLLFAVRTFIMGETFFIRVFPMFPWEIQVKLEYLTFIIGVPLLIRYIQHLYPKDAWSKIQVGIDIVSFSFMTVVMVTPALFYTRFLIIYQLLVLPTVIYLVYIFTIAMLRQRPASRFNFICLLIFMIACLNDALFYLNFINTGQFATKGFFIFLVSQTFVHGIKYSDAFRSIENLSSKLKRLNLTLEEKVEERTRELKQVNTRLQQVEQSRKALISDISHELSTPMTLIEGYAEAIIDEKIADERKYWHIVHDKSRVLKRLIKDLSTLSELELRKIKMELQPSSAKFFPQEIFTYFQGVLEANGYELHWHNRSDWAGKLPSNAIVIIDRDRIDQVFMNIMYNAMKYSKEVKKIEMVVDWIPVVNRESNRKIGDIVMQVIDSGQGIASHDLPHIFKRLYRSSSITHNDDESRGLGLAISKEIIHIHDGDIWAESKENNGSIFYISLPVYSKVTDLDKL